MLRRKKPVLAPEPAPVSASQQLHLRIDTNAAAIVAERTAVLVALKDQFYGKEQPGWTTHRWPPAQWRAVAKFVVGARIMADPVLGGFRKNEVGLITNYLIQMANLGQLPELTAKQWGTVATAAVDALLALYASQDAAPLR